MIVNILKNNFEWMKKDFFLQILLILISSLAFQSIDVFGPLRFVVLLFLFAKCISFLSSYSMTPSNFMGKDQFSWKFLQGLPIGKKELIITLILSNIIVSLPFFVFVISFKSELVNAFPFLLSPVHSLINICLFVIFMSFFNIIGLIQYPRKEFLRQNSKRQLIRFLRITLVIITTIVFLGASIDYVETNFNVDLFFYVKRGIKLFWKIITSWWSVPILTSMIFMAYLYTLKVWRDERISYSSGQMNPKKEYVMISVSSLLLFFMGINIDFKTPDLYRGELTKAVFQKNYQQIEKELKKNSNVNAKNRFDMSPMFVAIREGDLEMVKYLESKGATLEGVIQDKRKNYLGFDALLFAIDSLNIKMLEHIIAKKIEVQKYNELVGYYPIHLASSQCKSEMVDLLIKHGADINSRNQKGETPLIVAARGGCLSVAISLKEAGADFNIVDKSGKLAKDQIKKSKYTNTELGYFLEKNSRVPANSIVVPGPRAN